MAEQAKKASSKMTESISNSLKALKGLSPKLNQVADDSAQLVRDVEKVLDELSLGVSASSDGGVIGPGVTGVIESFLSKDVRQLVSLQYRRIGAKYRIVIVKDQECGDNWECVYEHPWLECSRSDKIETFQFLPILLENLVKSVNDTLEKMQKAIPEARKVLESLK